MSFIYSILTTPTNQAKTFSIDADGKLIKSSLANPTKGTFSTHSVESVRDFAHALDNITTKQTVILGQPHRPDGTALQAGEKVGLTIKAKPSLSAIPRSKEFIKNVNHAGFMLFDLDGNEFGLDDLKGFIPELEGVGAVIKPSSSSFIFDKNGRELIGNKGRHIYIPVSNLADVPRIAEVFWGRMWLSGFGFFLIGNGLHPQTLERGLFDKSVIGASERLAFEAKPILNDGLVQRYNHSVIIDGDMFDCSLIPDLTESELAQIAELKRAKRIEVKPELDKKTYIKKREYIAAGGTEKQFNDLKRGVLPRDFVLYTAEGEKNAGDLGKNDDGLTMADPNEPSYDGGSLTKAKFFWNDGNPKINSQAHGGCVYTIESVVSSDNGGGDGVEFFDDWKERLLKHVERMNTNHAQVIYGGKHRIIRFNTDKYELLAQKELELLAQNTMIKTGERETKAGVMDIYDNHIAAWAKHHKSRVYSKGVIFKPNGAVEEGYFNTWRGFAVNPKNPVNADVLELVYCHIEQIICNGDYRLIEYFYNWVAYTLQHPEKPAGAALVLRSGKGNGKGTIGHFLKSIWGVHGSHISNAKHLIGNFNGHLADTCFLFVDEAFFSADKQHEGVLKALITEPELKIERKGVDAVTCPNYLKVFMATNNDWAVPASKDERRYCVFDVSDSRKGDKQYFDKLHTVMSDSEVQAAFLHEMLARDISGFHTGQIPETEGLKDQRLHSLNSVGKWLVDCLVSGGFEISDSENSEWASLMSARVLFRSYMYWCDNQRIGEHHRATQTKFGRYLTDLGFEAKRSNGIFRLMLTHDEAIVLFERVERVTIPKMQIVPKLFLVG